MVLMMKDNEVATEAYDIVFLSSMPIGISGQQLLEEYIQGH
jgi:hypothetical protein